MHIASRWPLDLRGRAVMLGVAALLLCTFGHHLTGGLPRQEVCNDLACEVSIDWLGLLPSPVLVLVAAVYAVLTTGAALGLGLLWRPAR
jgi:hypothetical protein